MRTPDGYLTVKEAAKRAGVDYKTVMRWIWGKKLESIKPGLERFVRIKDFVKTFGGK